MPVIIGELSTTLEIQDEAKIRRLVREEIRRELMERRRAERSGAAEVDPADPSAGGSPKETGG